jgi:hypothetical protein
MARSRGSNAQQAQYGGGTERNERRSHGALQDQA